MVRTSICFFICVLVLQESYAHYPVVYSSQSPQSNGDYYRTCAPRVRCDPNSKYRTFNGSCNNLDHALWGSTNTPHLRLVDAVYSGGEREFRRQSNGAPLPGPRELQLCLLTENNDIYDDYNVHLMQWGQFVAHDITLLPPDDEGPANCCALNQNQLRNIPYQCRAVILLPMNDPMNYGGRTCLPFRRAVTSSNFSCSQLPNIFMVQTSQYIDGSHIYGPDDTTAASLRTFNDGLLRSEILRNGKEYCPQRRRQSRECDNRPNVNVCFDAGDGRVNQNLGIASYQNVFLRLHNFLAKNFRRMNQQWSDEVIYQEVRRIIGAIIQVITYRDFIPNLIGRRFSEENGLSIFKSKTTYDRTLISSTGLEFSVAAYRVPHNIIPNQLNYFDERHNYIMSVNLTDWMDNPEQLQYESNLDHLMIGMSDTAGRKNQPSYNNLISNVMFHFHYPGATDMSLIASDIQRGRDTGLPPYFVVRQQCRLSAVRSFEDLHAFMPPNEVNILKKTYNSVYDIDLIVGMLLEIPEQDSMIGPTAKCIIADGFYRYRYGDRFFFDVPGQPGSFSKEQVETLKNINMGHIFCATTTMYDIPKDFFRTFDKRHSSEKFNCKDLKNKLVTLMNAWKTNRRN
ncbi:peroxidase-like isoform X2 [Daktulosphaira vitifoliae]|uniref:peroxidase-like isoform X2 n=1 Tax=Daktulosphaira vitifoliae TaxID=58002 RepID=UPI0021A9C432|nr:peroxidase-like isoform X2 [Daktulosphaira vitifoliae]